MKRGILFTHIPKTAGTSFRLSTKRFTWSWKVYADYGIKNKATSDIIKAVYETGDTSKLSGMDKRKTLLAGHFPIRKYIDHYPVYRVITFMRDPVQRVISHYHDYQRRFDYQATLEQYYNEERFCNIQSSYFEGVPLEAVGAVGISEFYDESLELFDQLYGLSPPANELNANKNKKSRFYLVSGRTVDEIRRLNEEDCRLYEKALRIFLMRRQLQKQGKPYVYGKITSVTDHTVTGWAVNPLTGNPVSLDLMLNGKKVKQLVAEQPVDELRSINIANQGQVGFAHTFEQALRPDESLEILVTDTRQPILK